jgi:ubiquitin carboxyl-terminal hydrolase L3
MTHAKVFPPLESDPALFTALLHKLGASSCLTFTDVLSLDSHTPTALAYVLIAPCDEDFSSSLAREEVLRIASLSAEDKVLADDIIWVKQTIHNACGFYALLHAVCNIASAQSNFAPGSLLDAIIKGGNSEKRRVILEKSKALEEEYIPIALQGQTAVSDDWTAEPPFHYVAFVHSRGRIWELNGGREGPVDRGDGDLFEFLKERVSPEERCSLLALIEG